MLARASLLTRRRRWYSATALVFLLALGARLLYVSLVPPRATPDSAEYVTLARNVAAHSVFSLSAGEPLVPTIRRAPGYPLFLALAGDGTRAVQGLVDALTAAMICAIAAGLVRLRWAVAAALLWAAHPGAIVYVNSILSESLFTFLLTGAVALLVLGIRREEVWWTAAAGVAIGLAALTRPIGAMLVVPVAAVLLFSASRRAAALFCASALAVVAPWIVRSSLLGGCFVLVSTTAPVNYAIATANAPWDLNDQASIFEGSYFREIDPCGRALAHARTPRDSVRADDVCLHEALANLRRDPGHYLRGRASQLVHFPLTSFDFATGIRSTIRAAIANRDAGDVLVKLVLYALFSLAPLLLGIAGTISGRRLVEIRLAAAVWIFTIAFYAPGFVEYRYFLPAVPMLLVCAACGMEGAFTARTASPAILARRTSDRPNCRRPGTSR